MTITSLAELAAMIPDGATLAVPPSRSGVAMEATRALIARGVRGLHLIGVPTAGIQADMLIGAGCVAVMESAGVTLDEQGQAPRFISAVRRGAIELRDSTCPAILSALQAGEKGIPFIPIRGLIGSDLLKHRPDYRVIENPMAESGDPIVCLPAITPDIALFHAPLADRFGNVWIASLREMMTMAHAAKTTLVTAERITEGNLMEDPVRAPATIPALYVSAVAEARHGAWPLGLGGEYDDDAAALRRYAQLAKSEEDFAAWLADPTASAAQ